MPHITVSQDSQNIRIDRFLRRENLFFPQSLLEKWARQGKLKLNDKKVKLSDRVNSGDIVSYPDGIEPPQKIEKKMPLDVTQDDAHDFIEKYRIYDGDDFLILSKPAGLAVQGGTGQRVSVDDYLKMYDKDRPLRLTHRIDKDTSGILLIAKNANAASYYTQLFRDHKIQKTYLAITTGTPPQLKGIIDESLIKSKDEIEKIEIAHFGRNAVTEYKVLKQEDAFTLFELNPKTGRTHQIRVHLAHIECPIVGDKKYGGIAHPLKKSMCLHAYKIAFKTKSGNEVEFTSPLPPSFSLIK